MNSTAFGPHENIMMGTECLGPCLNDDSESIPPGFSPHPAFTLQRIKENDMATDQTSDPLPTGMIAECSNAIDEKFKKSLRNRPWVNYRCFDNSSDEEEPETAVVKQDGPSKRYLPKGVLRGCSECDNCQKVVARFRPEDACRPALDDAPVFYPSEEEFKDTLRYIASIRHKAEQYGICRIVPPPSWRPPCPLKEGGVWEHSIFATRIQQVDKLQNRSVKQLCQSHSTMKRKRRKLSRMREDCGNKYEKNIETDERNDSSGERFGFVPGPNFTLEEFQKYANDFRSQYFCKEEANMITDPEQLEPSLENIEGEYWRIVEKPTEQIEVLYGADLETGGFGSGFPKASSIPSDSDLKNQYVESGWNLNNLARLPGSVLSFESGDISGVLVPWLYIGMCFSSFCWHVEDHHLYSLNYLHWGAPKIWYGVPGKDAVKLETAMRKHLPELFEEQPDLLHNLVTQFSPATLKSDGVPVYRCVQKSGEFVLTFPRAYHSGFNSGFNCAEAVNVAPVDWLPHGQNAVELYREQKRKISISHDKLLLGAAREAIRAHWNSAFMRKNTPDESRWKNVCGQDGILAMALKARVEMERASRDYLCCSAQSRKMDTAFDANVERECFLCHYDLHLSAAGCSCSPDKFACLSHAKQLCGCDWNSRFFLFRYEVSELHTLVDALGGKLSAVHRWGVSDLGLSLTMCISKDKPQESKPVNRILSQDTKKQVKESINHGGSAVDEKKFNLLKEIKVPMSQPCSSKVPKETEKMVHNSAGSTIMPINPSFQETPPKPTMVTPASMESCSQGSISPVIVDQGIQSVGHRNTSMGSARTSHPEILQNFSPSLISLPTMSSGKNLVLCSNAVPAVKSLSESIAIGLHTNKDRLACNNSTISSAIDEVKGMQVTHPDKLNTEPFVEKQESVTRVTKSDEKVTCNSQTDSVLVTPETNASVMCERDIDLLEKSGDLKKQLAAKVIDEQKEGTCNSTLLKQQLPIVYSQNASHGMNSNGIANAKEISSIISNREEDNCQMSNASKPFHPLQIIGLVKTNGEREAGKEEPDGVRNLTDKGQSVIVGPSCPPNAIDRHNRAQKGPRMAKVVRRINCTVEPLEYGVVLSGKLWSTSQTIYPRGYRSRVRYLSIIDPTQMCHYISEILDAGLLGPLFMVKVEQCPGEVFFHVSASKCWDLVRMRVNLEIMRQHNLGRANLPSLQPQGSLDGLEMFGLSSPMILQAIEANDHDHVCWEYWTSKHHSAKPPTQVSSLKEEQETREQQPLIIGTNVALMSLIKKAKPEELQALQSLLSEDNAPASSKANIIQLLDQEIKKRDSPF
ncbi:hypothetical protein J5N97_024492 [Dioscorea zingiberensis]|uniref:Lysine-specific demethylase JMJ16 n=1 Tax=Dioscorea zingiberensis TaxID=325984 RepID=A0A9D5H8Z7_9LILI|nr:hypothetical protein J5N97_024492 [Dioscorea zingiberensis]